jgi:hypothetical protein
MGWILIYYLILKPLNVLPVDPKLTEKYDDADLIPRFKFFAVNIVHSALAVLVAAGQ